MSYQVLARKWRPRTFQELVGQEHVVRALVNALDNDRLHHAFLFTGTRGVGKTTIARILAKSLNCERGVSSSPCGVCSSCREIDEGRFVDLIEVDAASRTKVEDTRELLENVQYAPTRGRYKVYLIDEVHMLSNHSFNALLKTLEEPPPHIKFLLATTDPQKLPVTILSRCLQFNLKRLSSTQIGEHLETLMEKEGIEGEAPALALLARAGDGSVRDALSLLDQAIAFGGGRVGLRDVGDMLGTIDRRQVLELLEALAVGDAGTVLNRVAALDKMAPDYSGALAELISLLQRVALIQAVPDAGLENDWDEEALRRLAAAMAPEDLQLYYQIALIGRRDLPLSPEPRSGFEMVLLRMLCFKPGDAPTPERTPRRAPPVAASAAVAEQAPRPSNRPAPTASAPVYRTGEPAAPAGTEWGQIVASLGLKGMAQQLALNCALLGREGATWRLQLAPSHGQVRTGGIEEKLRAALEVHTGEPVRLSFQIGATTAATPAHELAQRQAARREEAETILNRDPNVQGLRETFNARIAPDSVKALDD